MSKPKYKIGSDSFFYQNKTHEILGWQKAIRTIAMDFIQNKYTRQRFELGIKHVPEVKQIIFEWDKIKSDGGGCETNEKFDIGDLMRIESDIGFPFLIKGWRYWFKHMACSGYSKFEVIVECGYYSYEGGFIFVRECNKL